MIIAKRLSLLARLFIAGVPLAFAAAPPAAVADAPATITAAGAPDATPRTQPIVVTPAGTIAGLRIGKMDAYRGIPYAGAARGAASLGTSAGADTLVGDPGGNPVRQPLSAKRELFGDREHDRGLPLPQRLRPQEHQPQREPPRHGLVSWRRLQRRRK